MSEQITVYQNDLTFELAKNSSLQDLLSMQQMNEQSLAVAVNQQVIPRAEWHNLVLNHGDKITVFQAIAGG